MERRQDYHVTAESIVIDGTEYPRVGEPWRRVLEPLTDRQLAACLRQARLDRREDVCGRPRGVLLSWHAVRVAEKLADSPYTDQNELFISHELLMHHVSKEVTEYWSHVIEENRRHHPGSRDDYLRSLVERIQSGRST